MAQLVSEGGSVSAQAGTKTVQAFCPPPESLDKGFRKASAQVQSLPSRHRLLYP